MTWLDNKNNVRDRSHENLVCEIVSPFTTCEGQGDTEVDIREMAGTCTSWNPPIETSMKAIGIFRWNSRYTDACGISGVTSHNERIDFEKTDAVLRGDDPPVGIFA